MIRLTGAAQLAKAIERARSSDLLVQPTTIFRQYRVTNRAKGVTYIVNFFVRKDGERFAACTCPAGTPKTDMNGKPLYSPRECKHLAAAAGLHLCIAAARAASGPTSH